MENKNEVRKPTPKAMERLLKLVGRDVTVLMRSCPEMSVHGTLDCFLFTAEQRIIIVDDGDRFSFVNFDDVSMIREDTV